jgi:hypothetical protein
MYVGIFTSLKNPILLDANISSPRCKIRDSSEKSINKSNICINNGIICININLILTNISLICTFYCGVDDFRVRSVRFCNAER